MNFKPLQKGDIVDIISPATACTKDEIAKIKTVIEKMGLTPRIFLEKELTVTKPTTHEFPSFDAKVRFAQLNDAIENTESKLIWCARGGYGSADLLPFLQKMKKPKHQKPFIGFSDIVSIASHLQQKWDWEIICAPMLGQIALNSVSKKSQKAIVDLIFGKSETLKYDVVEFTSPSPSLARRITKPRSVFPLAKEGLGEVNSAIVGGCISVLAGHFGTKNQLNWHDKILFLEDEGEDGERLERYFNQILTIIIETKQYPKAILLGNFLEANPHGTPKAQNIRLAIETFAKKIVDSKLKIPICCEKSKILGHSKNMIPLILGSDQTRLTKNKLIISL